MSILYRQSSVMLRVKHVFLASWHVMERTADKCRLQVDMFSRNRYILSHARLIDVSIYLSYGMWKSSSELLPHKDLKLRSTAHTWQLYSQQSFTLFKHNGYDAKSPAMTL